MAKQYSAEFKMEAIKRVHASNSSVSAVAKELGIKTSTLHGWIKAYRDKPTMPFPGSGKISSDDELIRKLERQNRELREENEILKKAAAYFAKNLK